MGAPSVPVPHRSDASANASAPDVVIWEADGRPATGGYGRPIARRLIRAGFSIVTVSLVERPPDLRELAAAMHVVSGGDTAVDADVDWLHEARQRLAWVLDEALAGRRSVTGICFGSQLIAHLLAGREATGPHPAGMQAGLYALASDGPAVSSFHYHSIRRAVIEQAGATVTGASPGTDVQAYRFGPRVRGVQFHPELTPARLRRTLVAYDDVLGRHGTSAAVARTSMARLRDRWSDQPWHDHVAEPALAAVSSIS